MLSLIQGTKTLGIALMHFYLFIFFSIPETTVCSCTGQGENILPVHKNFHLLKQGFVIQWIELFQVFLVPNWYVANQINIKCSRKWLHLKWWNLVLLHSSQIPVVLSLCMSVDYSIGLFPFEKCRFLISLIWFLHIRSCYKFQIRLKQNLISFLFLNRTA